MDGWRRNLQSSETRRGERSRLAWTGLDSTLVRQRFGSSRALAQLESSVVGRPLRGRRRIARRLGRVVFRSRVRVVDGLSRRDRQKRFAQPDDGVDQAENRQEYHPYGVLENHQNVSMLASSPAVDRRASPPMDPVGAVSNFLSTESRDRIERCQAGAILSVAQSCDKLWPHSASARGVQEWIPTRQIITHGALEKARN